MTIKLEELRAFVDGEIDATRSAEIERIIASDAILAEQAAAMEASRLPYRAAYVKESDAPPASLRKTIESWVAVSDAAQQPDTTITSRPKWMMAAAVAAALGIGAFSGAAIMSASRSTTPTASADQALPLWVERVAEYQSLYVRATVETTQDGEQNADKLLASVRMRTGMQTIRPDLTAEGYTFVRAQELGFEGQPLIQLVYLGDSDVPLALCFMPGDTDSSRVGSHAGLAISSWSDNGQRYVIVADESPDTMKRLQQRANTYSL